MAWPCSHDQFDELVMMLDMGRGRPKEAIEELRVEHGGQLVGFSALHVAANGGSLEVCRYLVEELLLDVDLVDNEGNCEMVELLLAKGAYVDPVAARGTPLHVVAGEGHYGATKILLDHNADYNKMVNGVTPLMAATDANSTECIKLLVKVQEEPMLKREIVTSGLISLGSISLKKKDYVVAAKLYSQAMQLDPDDAVLFSDRSLCWLHMGHGRKALLDANKCRKLRPHWPKACHRQGEALMLLKDYEGASERFLDGLKLDPVGTDIEDALREAMKSLKTSRSMKGN